MKSFKKPIYIDQRGFNIIELLVTTLILGALASISVASYVKYINSATVTAMKTESAEIRKTLKYIKSVEGAYHSRLYSAGYRVESGEPRALGGFHPGNSAVADGTICDRFPDTDQKLKNNYTKYFTLTKDSYVDSNTLRDGDRNSHRTCNLSSSCSPHHADMKTFSAYPASYLTGVPSACAALIQNDLNQYTLVNCNSYLYRVMSVGRGNQFFLATDQTGKLCYHDSTEWKDK